MFKFSKSYFLQLLPKSLFSYIAILLLNFSKIYFKTCLILFSFLFLGFLAASPLSFIIRFRLFMIILSILGILLEQTIKQMLHYCFMKE